MANPKIIGITGRKFNGKDSLAKSFNRQGYETIRFASEIKDILRLVLFGRGLDGPMIERMIEGDLKEVDTPYLSGISPRLYMQRIGTEFGRGCVHANHWIHGYYLKLGRKDLVLADLGLPTPVNMRIREKFVVTPDVRFANEASVIRRLGGVVVRVRNPRVALDSTSGHASETELESIEVDATCENTGTLDDLDDWADEFLAALAPSF